MLSGSLKSVCMFLRMSWRNEKISKVLVVRCNLHKRCHVHVLSFRHSTECAVERLRSFSELYIVVRLVFCTISFNSIAALHPVEQVRPRRPPSQTRPNLPTRHSPLASRCALPTCP